MPKLSSSPYFLNGKSFENKFIRTEIIHAERKQNTATTTIAPAIEQSIHLARKKPPKEQIIDRGNVKIRMAGILVKKKDAVVEGKTNIATTRITPTASKAETIVKARSVINA